MKIKELRELTKDELVARRGELKKESLNSRVQLAGGQLENTARFRHIRKEVARIETILNERLLNISMRKHAANAAPAPKAETAPTPKKAAKKEETGKKAPAAKKAATKKAPAKKAAKAKAQD